MIDKTLTKMNVGCADDKLEGYLNIDLEESFKPDLVADVRKELPVPDNHYEEIQCFHCIEHIEYSKWQDVFERFHNALAPDGLLLLEYPEFETVTQYYIKNYQGKRDFWRMVVYGGQGYPGDYHVTPVVTSHLTQLLYHWGFTDIKSHVALQEYNTITIAKKGRRLTKSDAYREQFFGIPPNENTILRNESA
jgi:predicted SAM-dependent methyltransferase